MSTAATRARVAARLVGRERELELVLSAVAAGRAFEPARGGTGGFVAVGRSGADGVARGGVTAPATTGEAGDLVEVEVRAAARRIAARLSPPRPRRDVHRRRGAGGLVSPPYRGGDDIDLDATLEVLAP